MEITITANHEDVMLANDLHAQVGQLLQHNNINFVLKQESIEGEVWCRYWIAPEPEQTLSYK